MITIFLHSLVEDAPVPAFDPYSYTMSVQATLCQGTTFNIDIAG